ncbi:MAG: hypothetical protein ABL962_15825, partial [Fimbriimonadaceae bacterium]
PLALRLRAFPNMKVATVGTILVAAKRAVKHPAPTEAMVANGFGLANEFLAVLVHVARQGFWSRFSISGWHRAYVLVCLGK